MNSGFAAETARIKNEYSRRDSTASNASKYGPLSASSLFIRQEIERQVASFFASRFTGGTRGMRVLEVGTGSGAFLKMFHQLGFSANCVHGIDLSAERLEDCRSVSGDSFGLAGANAVRLPYRDGAFDVVSQFTVLSSVTDEVMRKAIASEMVRVTRPGGIVISYDMIYSNPLNPNLRGVGPRELAGLFGAPPARSRRIVPNPLLLRPLLRVSHALCAALSSIRVFNAFIIAFFRKAGNVK